MTRTRMEVIVMRKKSFVKVMPRTVRNPKVLTRQEIVNKILEQKYSADNDPAIKRLEERLRMI